MENRKKSKLRFGGAILALASVTFLVATFLSEGGLRWVCRCVAGAFIILAIVSFAGANSEPA
jgi:hypothetical protein